MSNDNAVNDVVGSETLDVAHPAIVAFMAAPPVARDSVVTVSDLLALALRDLILCAQDANYRIDMSLYYYKDTQDDPCLVCLAGAVMAKEFAAPLAPDVSLNPDYFILHRIGRFNASIALSALDFLRKGSVQLAARRLGALDVLRYGPFNRVITPYYENPTESVLALLKLLADLRASGL